MEEGHEQGRTIDHRGIDGLALSRALGMPQRGEHADKQQHGAAAVVADKVEGRCRRLVTSPDVRKYASYGDVVKVVPGRACPGPVLTPPRHPSVDQRRPAREASLGREPEPLHHSGPESFDEHVRLRDEVEDEIAACFLPDVDDDTRAAAARDVAHRVAERQAGPGRLDADALSAEVGQHHRREGSRADPCHLDEAHARERSAHLITTITCVLKTASLPSGVHSSRVSVA